MTSVNKSCDTCKYGDNGSQPENCSCLCFEPELPDWEPESAPIKPISLPLIQEALS